MAAPEPSPLAASLARVRLVATQTFAEALRLRLTVLLVASAAMFALFAAKLREFGLGTAELRFLADFGLGAVSAFGTVFATFGLAHLYFRDIEGGMAALVLTRRVGRGEYLVGKLTGVAVVLAVFTVGLALGIAALLAWRGAQLGTSLPAVAFLQACAFTWLKLTLSAAMTLLVCSYARSALFAGSAGLLLTVAAQLRVFVSGDGWLAWLRLWPDFGLFETGPWLAGQEVGAPALLGLGAYWLFFLVLFSGLAAYVFRRREF